ncbi:hypothetical protein OSB04_028283 [Centaurea solstitialis]|uniref:ATP-dependent DNA helicase n=1 Tax=Centaurea solstitialis TaxID=347529 RepID=A0AA38VXJ5_9ASTR|nr:hypothetical protein OSB04_028283 [Centaurea solstitialis]
MAEGFGGGDGGCGGGGGGRRVWWWWWPEGLVVVVAGGFGGGGGRRRESPEKKGVTGNLFSSEQSEGSTSIFESLDVEIIQFFKNMLDSQNVLVKSYRMARDCFQSNPNVELKLRLIGKRQKDGKTYNLPSASEVAALIVGDIGNTTEKRDIIVEHQTGRLQQISELHPSYLPLQYPLLFPYGEDGYRVDIPHRGITSSNSSKRPNVTMREFFAFMIQDRVNIFSLILNARRLLQQLIVDEDRPDILCQLFKMKLDALIKDLKDNALFGKVQAVVYTVEFQKRDLPHSHICLFMHSDLKLLTVEQIDPIISAEIPDKDEDPDLYSLVKEFMIHGPCGEENINCPCMIDRKCSKNFPKRFSEYTSIDDVLIFPWFLQDDPWWEINCLLLYIYKMFPLSILSFWKLILYKFPTCYAIGLLDDDMEYVDAIEEASLTGSGLSLNDDQLKNLMLFEIEKILLRNSSSLKKFTTMPYPDDDFIQSSNNRLIIEELDYDIANLHNEFHQLLCALRNEQRGVYDNIISTVENNQGGVFFVYGYGGTGGRTVHTRFQIPLNLNEDSLCYIKPDSDVAKLIKKAKLIIWDEAPMVHRYAFEALDRSMNDIFCSQGITGSQMLFGGKVVVFGGDFIQILPVIPNASRQDIFNALLSSSYIWEKCKVLRLTKNMSLTIDSQTSDIEQTRIFANWLLDLGECKVGSVNDGEAIIDIPNDLLITDSTDPISALIEFVYPSILVNVNSSTYFQK